MLFHTVSPMVWGPILGNHPISPTVPIKIHKWPQRWPMTPSSIPTFSKFLKPPLVSCPAGRSQGFQRVLGPRWWGQCLSTLVPPVLWGFHMALASTNEACKNPGFSDPSWVPQERMQLRLLLWLPHGVTMIDVNYTIIIIRTASLIPSAMILSGETPP